MLHLDPQHWVSTCVVSVLHSEGDQYRFWNSTSATLLVALWQAPYVQASSIRHGSLATPGPLLFILKFSVGHTNINDTTAVTKTSSKSSRPISLLQTVYIPASILLLMPRTLKIRYAATYNTTTATAIIPKFRHHSLLTLAEGMTTDFRSFVTMNNRCETNTYTAQQPKRVRYTVNMPWFWIAPPRYAALG